MQTQLASDFAPGTLALDARDRTDRIVMGGGRAARHRVLRLVDPTVSAKLRRDALPCAKGTLGAPSGRVAAVRVRVASLLAPAPVALAIAA
jgi:hypothetical protein